MKHDAIGSTVTSTGAFTTQSTCTYTMYQESAQSIQNRHMEVMANTLAAPIAGSYCLTIIVIAVAILNALHRRYQHILEMEECASGERENADDNKRIIECAKVGHVEEQQ